MSNAVTHVHTWPVRVYYEDTDAGGIVYHGRYLAFAERARTEWLRATGYTHGRLREEFGTFFAVHRCNCTFKRPAFLDDLLEVRTNLVEIRGARITLVQEIVNLDQLLVRLEVELAMMSGEFQPRRVPKVILSAIEDNLYNC